jgi:hypothetical protein
VFSITGRNFENHWVAGQIAPTFIKIAPTLIKVAPTLKNKNKIIVIIIIIIGFDNDILTRKN